MTAETLVEDYLGRLDAAAWPLPADRRAELVEEVREHIEDALSVEGGRDETTVRNVLERLGRPEEIVSNEFDDRHPNASERPRFTTSSTPNPSSGLERIGAIEIIAILLVSIGAFVLPVIGPLVGLFFVWVSNRWTTRTKIVATVLVVILAALPLVLVVAASAGHSSATSLDPAGPILLAGSGIIP